MDDTDRDIMARTIVGEASNQPFEGQQAVANVILNRLRSGKFGKSISDVVFAPYQFEPWQTRRGELESIKSDSPAYIRAAQAIDAANVGDPTNGATHFLEPNIVRQRRGGTLPGWAQGPSTQIGNHLFFNPGGGGPVANTVPQTTKSPNVPAPYAPTQPIVNAPGNLAETFAALGAGNDNPYNASTPLVKTAQIGSVPMPQGGSDEVDPVFLPRTTHRVRPAVRKT